MTSQPPIEKGRKPTLEEERLVAIFAEIESKQLELLDQSAKRIIELVTALLGIVVAVSSFSDNFPPPYLANNFLARYMGVTALSCYIGALLTAMWTMQPGNYRNYRYNLSGMREVLDKIIKTKSFRLRLSGILFGLGAMALGVMIGSVLLV